MSGSHEKLPMVFWVQIALVLIVGVLYLTLSGKHHNGTEVAKHEVSAETKTALKPVGEVALKAEAGAATGASRGGEAIVKKTCAVCHIAGVANAPKLDASAKDDWTKRMAAEKGLDGLVASAKKGKNGMPANGTDPTLTAEELKAAVVHMLGQAGIEVAATKNTAVKVESKTDTPTEKATPAPVMLKAADAADVVIETKEAKVIEAPKLIKEEPVHNNAEVPAVVVEEKPVVKTDTVKEQPASPAEPSIPTAPKVEGAALAPPANTERAEAPTAPKAVVMPTAKMPAAPTAPTVEDNKSEKVTTSVPVTPKEEAKPAEPEAPKVEEAKPAEATTPSVSVTPKEEVKPTESESTTPKVEEAKPAEAASPSAPVAPKEEEAKPAEAATPSAPVAPKEEAKPTVPTTPKVEEAEKAKPIESAAIDLQVGEKVYKSICFTCHDTAIANAPKPGDKAAWTARIAKGMDVLYNTALKGDSTMPAMPAKGGNSALSDADVKSAVSYMVELSK